MKKILVASTLVAGLFASVGAFAADTVICAGGAAGPGVVPASGTAGTHFMLTPIAPKCSANTNVAGTDGTSGAWYAVGSNSVKGKNSFGGNTNGGSVAITAACAVPGGCTAAESVTARGVANTAAATS
ncbi:MAG TPA: hypothetical protein DHV85_12315 [Candidatus Accumulibacter sp.]|nr:hypothetical protein [Accumulibacter sp.]